MMDRRRFILSAAGTLVTAPLVVVAQPVGKTFSIGFLALSASEPLVPVLRALGEGLRDLGYVEGRNIAFERRYADGRLDRLPDLADDLVRLRVDVMIAGTNAAIAAAKQATTTIPIVMVNAVDPVAARFIADLARPGGNVTGLTISTGQEIFGKRLEILKEIMPRISRVAALRQSETGADLAALEVAARQLNVTVEVVDIKGPGDIEGAFAVMNATRPDALIVVGGAITFMRRQQIADLALKYGLPGIHALGEYAHAGLLISYGPSLPDLYRRAATYVDKILKGAKPADLPVEQPTKFELIVNLKTAKALGIEIPASILARADEVIE